MKLPRKLKKALKKAVNKGTGNVWKTNEITIQHAEPLSKQRAAIRKKLTSANGYAVLSSKLSPK